MTQRIKCVVLITTGFFFTTLVKAQESSAGQGVMYYFVELISLKISVMDSIEVRKVQMAHLQNIKKMASEGKLLLAGPFYDQDGGGLFILNVKTKEEAEDLIREDPAVKAGRFTFKIRPWITEKGMLSLEKND